MRKKVQNKGQTCDYNDYAANLVIRSELMLAISPAIRDNGWTQVEAAQFLGVAQPRISDVMQGRIERFSVDLLISWLQRLGKDASLQVRDNVFACQEKVKLALFVCGEADERLLANIRKLFAGKADSYELEIVDVLQNTQRAA